MRAKIVGAAASLLSVLPATSLALGLGEIHLRSRLNAPLEAEIDLVGAAPEDLPGLNAQLASRETFARYGLDYPAFLAGVSVRAVRTADGRQVIQVRSSSPVTEPFATLLVEATWPRGRITREYTVLLDPPVFAAAAAAPAPVAAPVTAAGERAGSVSRPAPPPVPAAPPPPAVQQAVAAAVGAAPVAPAPAPVLQSGTYTVRPGDTMSRIVSRVPGLAEAPRAAAIVSLYRQNPQAFDGNVNLLRAGSILRLPDQTTLSSLPAAEAEAELRRQAQEWQSSLAASPAKPAESAVAPAADPAALRLVPPAESSAPRSAAAGGQGGSSIEQRIARLEGELAESRRLLSLRDAELSRLREAVEGGTPATPAAAPVTPPSPTDAVVEAPAAEAPADPVPAAPAPAPAAAPAAAPAPPTAAAPASSAGIVAWAIDHWYYPAGIFVLLGGLLGLRAARRREEEEAVVFEALPDQPVEPETRGPRAFAPPEQDFGGSTLPLRSPNIISMPGTDRSLLDDIAADTPAQAPAQADGVQLPSLGTTGEFATVGDPLVEADWNISYGLYDQAADQLLSALEREPSRRDIKAKLLEVWFRSDDAERFLDVARELAADRDAAPAGEWEKILIMGRQLAPSDPLFADNDAAAGLASIDLNLEGGQNRVDFDVLAEPTRTSMAPYVDVADTPEPIEFPSSLDHDSGDDVLEAAIGKTQEQPRPDPYAGLSISDTAMMPKADRTTEVSIDDLDLDMALRDLADLDDGTGFHPLDDSQVADMLDASSLMPQMPDADAPAPASAGVDALDSGSWRLAPEDTLDPSAVTADAAHGMGRSAQTAVLPTASLQVTDRTAVTGMHLVPAGASFETASMTNLSALDPSLVSPTERVQLEPIELPTLEPATLSEVGTKIDLARAYMDMGDPEGARSILAEVVNEGSASQKQEAERLLAALPG